MATLTHAHKELFCRTPDERFDSLEALIQHCQRQKDQSTDRWHPPNALLPYPKDDRLSMEIGTDGAFLLNDWSFSQLCSLARVKKDTINRLSPETATAVFRETLPQGNKPLQFLTTNDAVRSIHGVSYTRLWNSELLAVVQEFATDFSPPQTASGGGTGLYAGEQDMFLFMIDPAGWAEINGEAFAPGFFLWNSEVGKRSVGISTFWWQKVCANHIVWGADEVVEFTRKHTANVHDALSDIRNAIEQLVEKRDGRRDSFAQVIQKAMQEKLGKDAEEVQKVLIQNGIPRQLTKDALKIAEQQGGYTIFSLVDALTRLAGQLPNAGDRLEADQKAANLLNLALAA